MPDEQNQDGEIIVYSTEDGVARVQLRAVGGTVWLSQAQMAELYGTSVPNIAQIIKRVLSEGEVPEATINSELIVRPEGSRQVQREVRVFNLDMILAVGYRVKTTRGLQFRQWATSVLKEYLVKGFAMNDAYLKDPAGVDYFDELLERIRDIRASEKRFYQKVRGIFAATSTDYSSESHVAKTFFSTIQNKLVYAVTGRTAAELVVERSDPGSESMGLTSWKGQRPRKADAVISKNYLNEGEIRELNRLTTMFLDFAEDRTRNRQAIQMNDWITRTDDFLRFNERPMLDNAGSVAHSAMDKIVTQRLLEFDDIRRRQEAENADKEESSDLHELLSSAEDLRGDTRRPKSGQ